jgi:YD repeat-containing protein
MKKIFILLTLICMVHTAFACIHCAIGRGTFDYKYKGNVMSAYGVTYTSSYKDDKEKRDTFHFFRSYDKQHKCLVWSDNSKTGFIFYRFGVFNGQWRPVEIKDDVVDRSDAEYIFSEDGKLVESIYPNSKIYYNSDGKEYCHISYIRPNFIREYKYTYYDQRGNDTATITINRIKNTTHRTKKFYNQKGYLTEVYENDSLTEYYKYDSAGLPITDSCKMNRDISFEREEAGLKTRYEYYNGALSRITRYDAKENEIYYKDLDRYEECFMKYDENNKITERKTNRYNKVNIALYEKSDNIDEPDISMSYRNDTLISIYSTKENRTANEEIITEIVGEEEDGKFNPDTTITRTTFDSNGNILSKKEFKNSKLVNHIKYTYSKQRKLLSIQSKESLTELPDEFNKENTWEERLTYNKIVYKYDKQNHLHSVNVLDGKTIKLSGYYANDRLVTVRETTDNGTQILTTYTYDSVGNITERIRNSEGVESITKTTFVYYDE